MTMNKDMQRRGYFEVAQEFMDATEVSNLIGLIEQTAPPTYFGYGEHGTYRIEGVFHEFDEIKPNDPAPQYRFTFHRTGDGMIYRDKAERI